MAATKTEKIRAKLVEKGYQRDTMSRCTKYEVYMNPADSIPTRRLLLGRHGNLRSTHSGKSADSRSITDSFCSFHGIT